jgi:ribosomal protein S18 acetylase RimI-like enzyme
MIAACEDWQDAPSRSIMSLLRQEYDRWHVDLGWDLERDWAAVEPARKSGLLPGWLARDAKGVTRGWAFGVDQPEIRQIGAVVADADEYADRLIAAASGDPLRETIAFVKSSPVVTAARWRRLGFAVQPYIYKVAPTRTAAARDAGSGKGRPDADAGITAACWSNSDGHETAKLLARAYAADRGLRPFARGGSAAEWHDYVAAITLRPGCGVFSPAASVAMRQHGELVGVALVTSIGRTTAHLAQLALDPSVRGRGISWTLLDRARANADRVLGASRLSLLVSEANRAALAIYSRQGFRAAGEFIAAHRPAAGDQPLRFINTAPATGGDSARL